MRSLMFFSKFEKMVFFVCLVWVLLLTVDWSMD